MEMVAFIGGGIHISARFCTCLCVHGMVCSSTRSEKALIAYGGYTMILTRMHAIGLGILGLERFRLCSEISYSAEESTVSL